MAASDGWCDVGGGVDLAGFSSHCSAFLGAPDDLHLALPGNAGETQGGGRVGLKRLSTEVGTMSETRSRVLIIANKTLGGAEMLDRIDQINTPAGSASFYLLVPATPVGESPWDGHDYRRQTGVEQARRRLEEGLEMMSELGVEVDGELGEADPIDAVRVLFDRGLSFDRILLSTFTSGFSRWLRLDVPHRLGRITDLPIEHIQSDVAASSG